MSHTAVVQKEQEDNEVVYIDLAAFAKDILEGDAEWFERIAKRELQKLESTGTTRD
jgi:hypothetical protein